MPRALLAAEPASSRSDLLAEPTLRHSLQLMVRRRVPASEADDIVQATLCDALAAPRAPADPTEIARWVMTIGRNKIADHFRRTSREERVDVAPAQALHEPHDERELLRAIADQSRAAGNLRTLSWVVREASGEQLADIADEERLAPAVVRQRVSRWRRHIRSTFLIAAASLALFLCARAMWPSEDVRQSTVAAPSYAAGTWRVVEANIPDTADPRLRKLAGASLASSRLVVEGGRARLETLSVRIDRGFVLEPPAAGAKIVRGSMTTFDGKQVPFEVRFEGDSAFVSGGGASFRLAR